ncbi:MAG: metallophosphoesterase [Chromatiales bacterium]|nr:metallophosphoesterase [Chromatiales bacterium]
MRSIRIAGFSLCLLLASGCALKDSMSARYQISTDKPDGFALSKNVVLVADNQLNHLYGEPIWMRSQLVTQFVRVSIRPVQQDLFGQGILRWVLDVYGSRRPVIHLGDAANMGCVGEFEAFLEIMTATGNQPWLMAPGNHDAFLMGNSENSTDVWHAACERAGGRLTKDMLVGKYLQHLHRQDSGFRTAFPDADNLPATGEWRSDAPPGSAFLRAVAWAIDESRPHRSFVVQEVDLGLKPPSDGSAAPPPVAAMLLDSSQFAAAPILLPVPGPNAGVNGDLQADQLEVVTRWLSQAPGNSIPVLMSHHPFGTLRDGSRAAVDQLRKQYDVPLYVSAHTHNGQYFIRGGSEGWLELNVGSIVDYPIEFRTFSIHEGGESEMLFRTPLFRIPDMWGTLAGDRAPRCEASWEAMADDPDFYLTYLDGISADPVATQLMLMTTLLRTYERLIDTVPSAADNEHWPDLTRFAGRKCCSSDEDILTALEAKTDAASREQSIEALIELGRFDRARLAADPILHRDYRVCQAVWASKYNKIDRRAPTANDPYILFSTRSGND